MKAAEGEDPAGRVFVVVNDRKYYYAWMGPSRRVSFGILLCFFLSFSLYLSVPFSLPVSLPYSFPRSPPSLLLSPFSLLCPFLFSFFISLFFLIY